MKTRTKTLLAALFSTIALGLTTNVYARGDHDGWRDGPRAEHRWDRHHDNDRHERWEHRHRNHGSVVYFGPSVYYPAPVYYTTRTYRYDSSPSVIIDLPTIVFR